MLGNVLDLTLGAVFQSARLSAACSFVEDPLCDRCGLGVPSPVAECGECRELNPSLARVRSLLWYGESARELLHRVKFGARYEVLTLFRDAFRQRFDPSFADGSVVVPVPLAPGRFAARGFNQAALLSRWISPDTSAGLVRVRETEAQSTLCRRERRKNLRGSFAWRSQFPSPERVLLVDDVFTTGSTVETCARVLQAAGTKEVRAWTLFRTVPPSVGIVEARRCEGL